MTPQQYRNTLDWVEALLSGEYTHGKIRLYNPTNNTYSALGVALVLVGHERVFQNLFCDYSPVIGRTQSVRQEWLDNRFGTNRTVGVIKTMNDLTDDYLSVAALLLNSCLAGERQSSLHRKMMEQFRAKQA